MSSKRCRIRFRSGGVISAVDEVTCDVEASVANKTKPDNQSLGVTVFVRLTGNTPQKGANNIAFARRTAIHLTAIMISPVGVKGQPFPPGAPYAGFACGLFLLIAPGPEGTLLDFSLPAAGRSLKKESFSKPMRVR